jgi:hypothetical protein
MADQVTLAKSLVGTVSYADEERAAELRQVGYGLVALFGGEKLQSAQSLGIDAGALAKAILNAADACAVGSAELLEKADRNPLQYGDNAFYAVRQGTPQSHHGMDSGMLLSQAMRTYTDPLEIRAFVRGFYKHDSGSGYGGPLKALQSNIEASYSPLKNASEPVKAAWKEALLEATKLAEIDAKKGEDQGGMLASLLFEAIGNDIDLKWIKDPADARVYADYLVGLGPRSQEGLKKAIEAGKVDPATVDVWKNALKEG